MKFKQKIYDIMAKRKAALDAAGLAMENGDSETYTAKMAEVDGFNTEIERYKALSEAENKDFGIQAPTGGPQPNAPKPGQQDSTKAFASALRNGLRGKAMTSGTDADGGYTVPEDIETQVRQYRDASIALRDFVTVENAATETGEYTYETRETAVPFQTVEEMTAAPLMDGPHFERIPWAVKDYIGVLPISNKLIEDSDDNIVSRATNWMGRKQRTTENHLILEILKAKTATAFSDLDDIRTALNVTLGSIFKAYSRIYTNDEGLDFLDRLKDANGRPLLGVDPTATSQLQLRAGANIIKVNPVPSSELPNEGTKIPFLIGSLPDAILLKERKGLQIEAFRSGSVGEVNALSQNATLLRAIFRLGVSQVDPKAWVNGYVDTATVTPASAGGENT